MVIAVTSSAEAPATAPVQGPGPVQARRWHPVRAFTPAPYTPNIRLIWWYTPCLSLTFTVRPSGVRASTSAGERAVPSASVTPSAKPLRISSVSGVSMTTV